MARHIVSALAVALSAATTANASRLTPSDLMAGIDAAVASGQTQYIVPPGVYNFSDSVGFSVVNATSLWLQADGATFLFAPGHGMTFAGTHNVSFTGATIDMDPLFFTQGTVTDVARFPDGYLRYRFTIQEGYPQSIPTSSTLQEAKTIFWDPVLRTLYHEQVQTTSVVHNATLLSAPGAPAVWEVYTFLISTLSSFTPPEGCLGTVSPILAPAIQCLNCSDMLLQDVTLWGSSAMGYVEVGGAGGSVIRRWKAERKPGTDRLLATSLDGIHSTSVGKGLQLLDSEVSFAGDDLFAVHCELGIAWGVPDGEGGQDSGSVTGTGAGVGMGSTATTHNPATTAAAPAAPAAPPSPSSSSSSSLWVIDTGGNQGRNIASAVAGDTLTFWALNTTMDPLGSAVVSAVTVVPNATLQAEAANATQDIARLLHITIRPVADAALLVRVDFSTPLPAAVMKRYSAMVQLGRLCGDGTVVHNTTLHDSTGGMRLKGVNVSVTNSTIARAYGMRMLPEVFWTQSVSSNISIINNTFVTTGHAPAAPDSIAYANDTCPGLVAYGNRFLP